MNGQDFGIGRERDAGERDDGPVADIEDQQSDQTAQEGQTIDFGEPGMRGGEFSKTRQADRDAGGFGEQDQPDQPEVLRDDRAAQNPGGREDEQIVNDVGDAVVAAKGGGGDAKSAGEDAIKNIRERADEEDREKNPTRNI